MMIECITVDDEPLALEMINRFVKQTPFLVLKNSFNNAIDALNYIQTNSVQLIFLDIQMVDFTGMELARTISTGVFKNKPSIIFTTAYSEYALEGYQVAAVDYLLKPFDYEDFVRSAVRVRAQLDEQRSVKPVFTTLQSESMSYVFIKVDAQIVRVEIKDILYIEGYKDYVKIYLKSNSKPMISLMSLKKLEEMLNDFDFLRIHRSFIVSFSHVDSLLKGAVRIGEKVIPVGTTYKKQYDSFVNRWIK